jgi:ketosteroid isomerase-like protein
MALTVEDVLAIQQLAAVYNHTVDAGDGAGFAATFVADGKLITNTEIVGRAALTEFAPTVPQNIPRPRHIITNLVIEGSGDAATLSAYLQIYGHLVDGAPPQIVTSGVYTDTLRREGGSWLFVERHFVAD